MQKKNTEHQEGNKRRVLEHQKKNRGGKPREPGEERVKEKIWKKKKKNPSTLR